MAVMLQGIRDRLNTIPFAPFTIVLNRGNRYEVPHTDYCHVGPGALLYVFVRHPDGEATGVRLSPLHVTEVVSERQHA